MSEKVEKAQKVCVRVPCDISSTMAAGRAGNVTGSWSNEIPERVGTEIHLLNNPRATVIIPAEFNQLTLALDIRKTLTPALVRDFVIALALSQKEGRQDGLFRLRESDLASLRGSRTREYSRQRGNRVSTERRCSRSLIARTESSFETLSRIYVKRIGSVSALAAEPLMQAYRESGHRLWKPATLAYLATVGRKAGLQHSIGSRSDNAGPGAFCQVPLRVLTLDARDAALGIGLCTFLRSVITRTVNSTGVYTTELADLLRSVGANMDQKKKVGRSFWSRSAEQVCEVASEGQIASVSVAGEGPKAEVSLEPSYLLGDAYSSMITTHARRVEKRESARAQADAGVKRKPRRRTTSG